MRKKFNLHVRFTRHETIYFDIHSYQYFEDTQYLKVYFWSDEKREETPSIRTKLKGTVLSVKPLKQ